MAERITYEVVCPQAASDLSFYATNDQLNVKWSSRLVGMPGGYVLKYVARRVDGHCGGLPGPPFLGSVHIT